jgi:LytS/YehU family sensor histidine kinase
VDVPSELDDVQVPSFLLQPFVENALCHGLRHQPNGGRVDISAHGNGDRLIVRVDDEPLSRRAMRQLLDAHGDIDVIAECADATSAELRPRGDGQWIDRGVSR